MPVAPGLLDVVVRFGDLRLEVLLGERLDAAVALCLQGLVPGVVQLGVRELKLEVPQLLSRQPVAQVLLAPAQLRLGYREQQLARLEPFPGPMDGPLRARELIGLEQLLVGLLF